MALTVFVIAVLATNGPPRASDLDDRIESSAESTYVFQTYLKDDEITVVSKDGVVTLTGTVLDDFHKSLAQETVARLPGVKSVDNRLKLKGGPLAEKSDAWITSKVKTALLFRRNVDASVIQVSVKDGIATLRGDAISQAQKEVTTEYARTVEGVKGVRNEMTVSTIAKNIHEAAMRGKIDDASVTAQVRMALLFHRSTSVLNTQVDTDDGVVTLRGEARNVAEKELVGELVNEINGVKKVRNEMSIVATK
ncbi:MAG: BON domain-containing protein [Deferrisomatales bacterium]